MEKSSFQMPPAVSLGGNVLFKWFVYAPFWEVASPNVDYRDVGMIRIRHEKNLQNKYSSSSCKGCFKVNLSIFS